MDRTASAAGTSVITSSAENQDSCDVDIKNTNLDSDVQNDDNNISFPIDNSNVEMDELPSTIATKMVSSPESDSKDKVSEEKTGSIDPYAYTKADAFTSEIFKVEIQNFHRFVGVKQLKKWLGNLGQHPCKVKMVERSGYAFVNFSNEDERTAAINAIDGYVWKNRTLRAKKANPAADPMALKRKQQQAEVGSSAPDVKRSRREEDNRSMEERVKDAVTPCWKLEYAQQLKEKQADVCDFLKTLVFRLQQQNQKLHGSRSWLAKAKKENNGLICELLDIKPSPVVTHYRNKCEFTIGQSAEEIDKTVGFRVSKYRSGVLHVVWPGYCSNVNSLMIKAAQFVEEYCQKHSDLPGFHPEEKTGNWRQVAVKTTSDGSIMLVLLLHKEGQSEEKLEQEKEKIRNFFTSEKVQKELGEIVLYLNIKGDDRFSEPVPHHLAGNTHIQEKLLDLSFRISPDAFFQVNTPAAEVLYKTICEWAEINENTVLFDVCCGTGTIGLTMAKTEGRKLLSSLCVAQNSELRTQNSVRKSVVTAYSLHLLTKLSKFVHEHVKRVVGIEMNSQAVSDAQHNAELNGLKNVEFHCGKAENIMKNVIGGYKYSNVVAVVDPPRGGLHTDVVQCLRNSACIKTLVFVSCALQKGVQVNLVDLMRRQSRRFKEPPFHLKKTVAVDMFPQTKHFETVMLLHRSEKEEENETEKSQKGDTEGNKVTENTEENAISQTENIAVKEEIQTDTRSEKEGENETVESQKGDTEGNEVIENTEENEKSQTENVAVKEEIKMVTE